VIFCANAGEVEFYLANSTHVPGMSLKSNKINGLQFTLNESLSCPNWAGKVSYALQQ
jgi:hypothetical protein